MLGQALVICEKELRSLRHNPSERLLRLARPMLWLVLFGSVGSNLFALTGPASHVSYRQFMLPGILINAVLASAISLGITLKWEFDLGILSRMLVAPIHRMAIVLGKALASVASSFVEATVLLLLSSIIGISFYQNVPGFVLSMLIVAIFVLGAASLGMILAILLRSREAYFGVAALIAGPSLFASNSLYNLDQMPYWLRLISEANPVTYAVDFIRSTVIYQNFEPLPLVRDLFAVLCFSVVGMSLAATLFRRMTR